MTRSEKILALVEQEGKEPHVYDPNIFTPLRSGIAGGLAAVTAASIGYQVHRAHAETHNKIQQAGLGKEHTKEQQKLRSLRLQHAMTLGTSPTLRAKVQYQKNKVKDIENKGLERFHKGLIVVPPSSSSLSR